MVCFKFLEHDNTLNKVSQFLLNIVYKYIEDIHYFGVNTKYISSRVVTKKQYFYECVARVKTLILHWTRWNMYGLHLKKVNVLFMLYWKKIQKAQTNFSPGRFSFDLTVSVWLLGITLGVKKDCD